MFLRVLRIVLVCLLATVGGCSALKRCAYEGFDQDERRRTANQLRVRHILPVSAVTKQRQTDA